MILKDLPLRYDPIPNSGAQESGFISAWFSVEGGWSPSSEPRHLQKIVLEAA